MELVSENSSKRPFGLIGGSGLQIISHVLRSLAVPVVLLVIAYLLMQRVTVVHHALLDLAAYVPYALFAAALALSWRFNRSRAFFLLVFLAVTHWVLSGNAAAWLGAGQKYKIVYAGLCVLLPANFLIFSLLKERGIFTRHGFLRFAFIAGQLLVLAGLAVWYGGQSLAWLMLQFDSSGLMRRFDLPQPAQVVTVVALLFLLARLTFRPSVLEGAFIGALLAAAIGLNDAGTSLSATMYMAVAGLIVTVALVQDSYSLAFHDELTGLPGRRAFNEQLLKLSSRYVVAMADVDHFKKFNDTYGHDVGDQVLRYVASRLTKVGAGGKAYRYGGEEFVLVFPGRNIEDVTDAVKKLCANIAASKFTVRAPGRPLAKPDHKLPPKRTLQRVSVTLSFGLAEPDDRNNVSHDVVSAADKALYRAKQAGRNRVSI